MTLIETHCHLDYLKQLTTAEIIKKAQENGVEKFITISVEPDNLCKVIELTKQFKNVYCSQGIHPHDAKLASDEVLSIIKENTLKEKKVVALGEMGLDYHYNNSPKDIQIEYFEKQLKLACELNKPVVIHTRDADDDTISILKKYSAKLKHKGVLHSFTSGKKLAEFALSEGFYLGFNGIITFKNAQNVREIVELTPIERLLIETDSPFLAPVPHRGSENAPFHLPLVAAKIAEIKNISVEAVAKQSTKNATDLFQFLI